VSQSWTACRVARRSPRSVPEPGISARGTLNSESTAITMSCLDDQRRYIALLPTPARLAKRHHNGIGVQRRQSGRRGFSILEGQPANDMIQLLQAHPHLHTPIDELPGPPRVGPGLGHRAAAGRAGFDLHRGLLAAHVRLSRVAVDVGSMRCRGPTLEGVGQVR